MSCEGCECEQCKAGPMSNDLQVAENKLNFFRHAKNPKRSFPTILSLALMLFFALSGALHAETKKQYRVALAKYAFQELHAMPTHTNLGIAVGDIVDIANESVHYSAIRCYPFLETLATDPRYDYIETSQNVMFEASGGGEVSKVLQVEVGGQHALASRSSLFIDKLQRIDPKPDLFAIDQSKVAQIPDCDPVRLFPDGTGGIQLQAATVFRAEVSGGFLYETSDKLRAEAQASKLAKKLTNVKVKVRYESDSVGIHLTSRQWGTIAVQGTRLNLDELTKLYVLFKDKPATVADFESKIHEYIMADDPGLIKEITWWFRKQMEELKYSEYTIEYLKRQLFASKNAVSISRKDYEKIPQEYWQAASIVFVGAIIVEQDKI